MCNKFIYYWTYSDFEFIEKGLNFFTQSTLCKLNISTFIKFKWICQTAVRKCTLEAKWHIEKLADNTTKRDANFNPLSFRLILYIFTTGCQLYTEGLITSEYSYAFPTLPFLLEIIGFTIFL